MNRFEPGTVIAIRGHTMGKIRTARPAVVVEDSPSAISYWWPIGMTHVITTGMTAHRDAMLPYTLAELDKGRWKLTTAEWKTSSVLATTIPGSWAVVWHMWRDRGSELMCWYIDLKRPHQRTPVGFDTYDLDLDIVVRPDGGWDWKDRHEFAARRDAGFITDVEAVAVQAAGYEMIERVEAKDPPFDGSLLDWRPDPSWPMPVLPEGWDVPPLA